MIRLSIAIYRLLLRLAPQAFREEHGAESLALFRRMLTEARSEDGFARAWRIAVRGWVGVTGVGIQERIRPSGSEVERRTRPRQWTWHGTLTQASRAIVRRPGVTAGVVALLGLGIGATVTVLSVVDGVLIRPLPYPEPDRLAVVDEGAHAWPDFQDWTETVPAFQALAAASGQTFTLTEEMPRHIVGARVSEDFFGVLGASTALGRLPSAEEHRAGRRVVALSHAAWTRRWGADPGIVGSPIPVDGEPHDVVGVLAPDFVAPAAVTGAGVEVWIPVDPTDPGLDRHDRSFAVVGRLADGATIEQASAELEARAEIFAREYPDYATETGEPRRTFPPVGLEKATTGDTRDPLLILMAGAALLLLVACGNAASLLSARGVERRDELAVRQALGGGGRVIFGQLAAEGILLGLAGGGLGLALASVGVEMVRAFEPGDLPRISDIGIDARIGTATTAIAIVTGLLAGLAPAWRSRRVAPADALRGSRSGDGGSSAGAAVSWLVGAQATLASVLLLGSLAVAQGFTALVTTDPGFDPMGVHVLRIDVGRDLPEEERPAHVERIRQRLEAMPGVESVGAGIAVPYEISGGRRCCWLGELTQGDRHLDRAWVHPVTHGYFDALAIDFQEGRGFGPDDRSDGTVPIVINGQTARALFGAAPAVGAAVRFASLEARVVGVIDDVRHWGADQPVEPEFYLPYDPRGAWASGLSFVARAAALPPLEALRSMVSEVAPRAIVDDVQPMSSILSESRARHRFYTLILSIFAACAVLLAAAGLAGTLLYDTWRRRRELGIRMALGAPPGGFVRTLMLRALALISAGGTVGVAIYWPLRTRLDAVVPGVDPADPTALVGLAVVLAGAALAAAGLPARLVAAMDPARTLRP